MILHTLPTKLISASSPVRRDVSCTQALASRRRSAGLRRWTPKLAGEYGRRYGAILWAWGALKMRQWGQLLILSTLRQFAPFRRERWTSWADPEEHGPTFFPSKTTNAQSLPSLIRLVSRISGAVPPFAPPGMQRRPDQCVQKAMT